MILGIPFLDSLKLADKKNCQLQILYKFLSFTCFGWRDCQVIQDPDLRERHLGDLQGLILREAAKTCPEAYQASLSHQTNVEIPVRTCSHCNYVDFLVPTKKNYVN